MSLIIAAPAEKIATYDVANQTDIQFNFELDPGQIRADGTTLIIENEGNEIHLENFYAADGTTQVENFLTPDGDAFSASDFLSAIMGTDGGADAELETAADGAAGGSGAGAYSDDPGSLFDGLDALGNQPDAYDQPVFEPLEEVTGLTVDDDGGQYIFPTDEKWGVYDPQDYYNEETETYNLPDSIMDQLGDDLTRFSVGVEYKGSASVNGADANDARYDDAYVNLTGRFRHMDPDGDFVGTDGVDTLNFEDVGTQVFNGFDFTTVYTGYALRLEDDFSFANAGPHVQDIEVINASSGDDIIDLSSAQFTYGPVTVFGNDGNDVIWTNDGADTVYGGLGNDAIIGGVGDDEIFGGDGSDTLDGGFDNDIINGGNGNDVIFGGEGADSIQGGSGQDEILGGNGADFIHGGSGQDEIFGGDGNDTINPGTGKFDSVTLGDGSDTVHIDASSLTQDLFAGEGDDWSASIIRDFVDGVDHIDTEFDFVAVLGFNDDSTYFQPALAFEDSATGNNTIVCLDNWTMDDFYNSQLYIELTTV